MTRPKIANNAVNAAKIANGQVTRAKIANNAVNAAKIANGQVTRAKIANNAVNAAKIANGQVTRPKIANNAIDAARIANGQVTNAKLANNSVNSPRIADGQVMNADLANNSVNSAKIANGSIQIGDISADAQAALTAVSGVNWGVMDRGVIGNGDAYLRAGPAHGGAPPFIDPAAPPLGVGSLGIRTGADTDKASFGNEADFVGQLVSDLTVVSAFMYTTGENITTNINNLPSIAFEIDPNLASAPLDNFATMVFAPPGIRPLEWIEVDGVNESQPRWGLSSVEAGTPCELTGSLCTFPPLLDALDDGGGEAIIGSVAITKGRDFAFSGAVDALQINDTVYDFEPNGVFATPAGP